MSVAALLAAIGVGSARAQTDGPSPSAALVDPAIQQAGCASCGGEASLGCNTCLGAGCDGPRCVPGRMECCEMCEADNIFGRIWCGLSSMCCPDPCYQPCYIPAADAAFFQDSAKPVSRTRFRWDAGVNGTTPDRAEVFWSRIGARGPANRESDVDYHELMLYTEVATQRFSFFTYMPYRSLDPTNNPHAAGFGNLVLGTKSMMIDSELLLFTFQFKTIIPTANARKGIDNGHTTLEPSLLATLKVLPDTYIQTQVAEWIPIAGDPDFAGAMLHYHISLNRALIKPNDNFQFIGTIEFNGYSFQDGLFTPFPAGPPVRADRYSYFSVGPGFRIVFCSKFDIGFGMAFSTSSHNFAADLYRTEVRWRF
jgi:hypothetical protein